MSRNRFVRASIHGLLAACWIALLPLQQAAAQGWPAKPITMIIVAPAGGPADIPARLISEPVKAALGQPLVIENVAGAGGSIAVTRAVRSAPDGYTIVLGNWNSNVAAGSVYPLPYDLLADLEPVAMLTSAPMWIVGRNTFPAKDVAELTKWLKSNPEQATVAIVGVGTGSHVSCIHFLNQTGTKARFVPYRGGGPAYQDLAAGHVDLMCAETSGTRSLVAGGSIKAFAVLSKERWPGMPNVPTADELGVPGLHVTFWHAVWAPKGTPKDIISRLNRAINGALAAPEVKQKLTELGLQLPGPGLQDPAALAAMQKSEIEKWAPIIKAANIKPE